MTTSAHHLYILTGASRGMGWAMAQQLLQPGHHLLCLSRNIQPTLQAQRWHPSLAQEKPSLQTVPRRAKEKSATIP
jgi:NAD(P)-dependent dehydrogenase (short-subunit alcohol dehydrogenase family)